MTNKLSFRGIDKEADCMVFSDKVGLGWFFELVDDGRIDKIDQLVCPDKNGRKVYAGDKVDCVPLYHLRKVLPEQGILGWCDLTFGWVIVVDRRKYALANFTTIELMESEASNE